MRLFLCLPPVSLGQYCQRNVVKSGGIRKKIYKGGWPYRGAFKPTAHHAKEKEFIQCFKTKG